VRKLDKSAQKAGQDLRDPIGAVTPKANFYAEKWGSVLTPELHRFS
jgi:hypothetical protein